MMSQTARINTLKASAFFALAIVGTILFLEKLEFVPSGTYVADREIGLFLKSRSIALALSQYANEHGGKYPDGPTSTEIFQDLLDGKYVSDSSVFYYAMPGKTPAQANRLKPQNVCWDVTGGVDAGSPDDLPVVFLTGYKIVYQPGTKTRLLPAFVPSPRQAWIDWWNKGYSLPGDFTCVSFKSNITRLIDTYREPFMSPDFDPKGKTYRQLTPDGELPP